MARLHTVGNATIRVYANDHMPPHFHVVTPDTEALVEIATLVVLKGALPTGWVGRDVAAWSAANKQDIIAEWNRTNPRFQIK